jgi:hypothetical protein
LLKLGSSFNPIWRSAAVTVRRPRARMVPRVRVTTLDQVDSENSGRKVSRTDKMRGERVMAGGLVVVMVGVAKNHYYYEARLCLCPHEINHRGCTKSS